MSKPVSPETTLAVIMGASEWTRPDLAGGPTFLNSAMDFRDYLLDPNGFGLPKENLLNYFNSPSGPEALLTELGHALAERSAWMRDVLVYYVGHGVQPNYNNDEYFLAIRATKSGNEDLSALRMSTFSKVIHNQTRHVRRTWILDCCHAGLANVALLSDKASHAFESLVKQIPHRGTLALCSSSRKNISIAPTIERHTMFTGGLLKALRAGSSKANSKLTWSELYDLVWEHICDRYLEEHCVRPELHCPNQDAGDLRTLEMFPNPYRLFKVVAEEVQDEMKQNPSEESVPQTENQKQQLSGELPDLDALAEKIRLKVLEDLRQETQKHHSAPEEPKKNREEKPVITRSKPTVMAAGTQHIFREAGLEIPMIWCPPGSFLMGSPEWEKERVSDETQHKVTLTKGFWLGQTEVTQAHWQALMPKNRSHFKGENLPVDRVSWDDATEFIRRLNAKLGKAVYRLPTEAEWEYACRAGTTTLFHTGANLTTDQANYNGEYPYADFPKGEYRKKTTPVGSFPGNAWGLQDMHGNLWEWCQDWLGDYQAGDQADPSGPDSGARRVLRGGSWFLNGGICRSASRFGDSPDNRDHFIGFRLARGH